MRTTSDDEQNLAGLEALLEHLRLSRGFDFTSYKRTTLARRIIKRMQTVGVRGFAAYRGFLDSHPQEFEALFSTILINVTAFFRDADAWDALRDDVLPAFLASRDPSEPVRVWSAGCASGQEPYSIVMLLAEALGYDAVRARLKVYATDVDEEALAEARRAVFTAKQIADLPGALASKYFAKDGTGDAYAFDRDLRRCVVFGRHDLSRDAPICRVDLLLCRNTLMYFNADAQARIMARLVVSVNPGGLLLLGRAEMLFSHAGLFHAVDRKHRIFRIVSIEARLRDAASKTAADAQILTDAEGRLEAAYQKLQSTAQQLETTNEELESTNEALETMNEELQTMNDELAARTR